MSVGSVYRMSSWSDSGYDSKGKLEYKLTYVHPDKKKVGVFVFLGEEPKNGSTPLDLEVQMNKMGWYRK